MDKGYNGVSDVNPTRALVDYMQFLDPDHVLSQQEVLQLCKGTGKYIADDPSGRLRQATPVQRLCVLDDCGYNLDTFKRRVREDTFELPSVAMISRRLDQIRNTRLDFGALQQRIIGYQAGLTPSLGEIPDLAGQLDISQLPRFCRVVASIAGTRRRAADVIDSLVKLTAQMGFGVWDTAMEKFNKPMIEAPGDCTDAVCAARAGLYAPDLPFDERIQMAVEDTLFRVCGQLRAKISDLDALMVPGEQMDSRISGVKLQVSALERAIPSIEQIHAVAASFYNDETKYYDYMVVLHLFDVFRDGLARVSNALSEVRGFILVDQMCREAPLATSLRLFSLEWLSFRGLKSRRVVSDLAEAIITQDLARLKALIGGRDLNEMSVPARNLPASVLRWGRDEASLLEVASSVGGESLRYLLEFHAQQPGHRCLCQAVALGDPETIRMVWDRMGEQQRVSNAEVLRIAIDFHHPEVSTWLIAEQPSWYLIAMTFGILDYRYYVVGKMSVLKAEDIRRPSQETLDRMVFGSVDRGDEPWLNTALLLGGSPDATVPKRGSIRSESAIVLAAERRNIKMVRALLQHGAQVDGKGDEWKTALQESADDLEIASLLLSWGANPNTDAAGSWGNPLAVAASRGAVDCVRVMIEHGAEPSRFDWTGNVLHWAMRSQSPECVSLLLNQGADPNGVISESGDSPMHVFASLPSQDDVEEGKDSIELLEVMRQAGALQFKNHKDMLPVEIARRNERISEAVLRWFEEWNVE
jgi:hypothetical protein